MLQASNQYLRPDYLATLPNAQLDTKSSPLALLAQTCSAIGSDTTNPKLLAANIEKSAKSVAAGLAGGGGSLGRDKSSPVSNHSSSSLSTGSVEQIKATFKPYETNNNSIGRERDRSLEIVEATNLSIHNNNNHSNNNSNGSSSSQSSQRVKTPKTSSNNNNTSSQHNGQPRCDSNQSATSQRDSPSSGGAAATSAAGPTTTTMTAAAAATAATNGQRRTPSGGSAGAAIGPLSGLMDLHGNGRSQSSSSPHQHHLQQQQQQLQHHHQQQQQLPRAPSKESSSAAAAAGRHTPTAPQASPGGGGGMGVGLPPHTSSAVSASAAAAAMAVAANSRLQVASDAAYAAAKEASYVKALHAAAAAAGIPTTSSAGLSGPGSAAAAYYASSMQGGGLTGSPWLDSRDLMAASALMSSQHHPMFKAAAMNPYLNYARLKGMDPGSAAAAAAAAAAAMMSPNVCRDPYCTGCPASPHFLNKAAGQACPPGCPQCDGSAVAAAAAAAKAAGGGSGGGQGGPSQAAAAAAAAAQSYHAQLAALAAASQMPYVCSWIGNDAAYCGKRFSTSDELFQHLRTHTASMPDSVLSAAAAGGIPPNHPLFQRTYPTPPLSPLSAAARYHPYGKPSMLPPSLGPPPGSLAGLQMPPHPALAQYFSPYSLYGPRMGSSHP